MFERLGAGSAGAAGYVRSRRGAVGPRGSRPILQRAAPAALWSLLLVLAVGAPDALAAPTGPPAGERDLRAIQWRNSSVPRPAIRAAAPADLARTLRQLTAGHDTRRVLLQFDAPVNTAARQRLAALGIDLLSPLGRGAYFATVRSASLDADAAARVANLSRAAPIAASMKVHEDLHRDPMTGRFENVPEWSRVGLAKDRDGEVIDVAAVYVIVHPDVNARVAREVLESHEATIVSELRSISGFVVELPVDRVPDLAQRDIIQWIEPPLPLLGPNNDDNRIVVQADVAQQAPYNLDGSGVVVLVYDTGNALVSHTDFGGRLTARDGAPLDLHTTHVSGTIGGSGAASGGQYRGMAPAVTMENFAFQQPGGLSAGFLYTDPGDLEGDYDQAMNLHGAVLSNNSIGSNTAKNGYPCDWEGNYGATSALIDAIVRGSLGSPMRIVWSAGNERGGLANCGSSYFTTAPPAGAKNHLSVGSINSDTLGVSFFSSWGPTDDGRLKPDLCAPGCQVGGDQGVTSCANAPNSYAILCGTSMSTPTVTGCAALLLQDFRLQFPGRPDYLPSTQKVLFVHNAVDVADPGPDYTSGYGLIKITETIDFMRTGNFVESAVDQGESYQLVMTVAPGAGDVRITLAWDDVPGTPNVSPALVNDLDLTVTGPGGPYFPWTLDPGTPSAPAQRNAADHLNNIEQVVIDDAAPGVYTIQVHGFDIPQGPQSFSLAAGAPITATTIQIPGGAPDAVPPGLPTTVTALVIALNESLAGTPVLHYQTDGPDFTPVPMVSIGNERYEASLPAAECATGVRFYVSAVGASSGPVSDPPGAPADLHQPLVGTVTDIFHDEFQADLGWQTLVLGAIDGFWERGIPVGDPAADYGPFVDGDGSGQCYMTGNQPGNSDLDDGAVRLTSPAFDLTGPGEKTISYDYYLYLTRSDLEDELTVEISSNGDVGPWTSIITHRTSGGFVWQHHEISEAEIVSAGVTPSSNMMLRFTALDADTQSIVEAAVDAVLVSTFECVDVVPECPADTNGDTEVNTDDFLAVLGSWGPGSGAADINDDGNVNTDDFLAVLAAWGPCP